MTEAEIEDFFERMLVRIMGLERSKRAANYRFSTDQKRHPRQQCSIENVFVFSGKKEIDGCSRYTIGDQCTCSTFIETRSRQKDRLSAREQRPRVLCSQTIRHVKRRQYQSGVASGGWIENNAIEVSLRHDGTSP